MRPLTASKIIPGRKQQLLDVHSLFDLPNRTDKDYMDYLAIVSDDLDKRGMEWPILVIKKDGYWDRFPWQDDNKMAISDLKFDKNGNLWGLLSGVENPLFVKTTQNEWHKFSISSRVRRFPASRHTTLTPF